MNRTKVAIAMAVILLVAAFLRLYHLNFQSLWIEELGGTITSNPESDLLSINSEGRRLGSQAFFLFLHLCFKIFGYDQVTARVACAILGILSIPVLYLIGRELKNPQTGLVTALLGSVNFWHIYYSQEVNYYSMGFLFSALSYLFFIRAKKKSTDLDFALYIVSTILLLQSHSYGFVILLSQLLTLGILYLLDRDAEKIKDFGTAVIVIILFAPFQSVVYNDLLVGYEYMQKPPVYFFASSIYNYVGKNIVLAVVYAGAFALFIRAFIRHARVESSYTIAAASLLIPYIIIFVLSLRGNSIIDIRFTIAFLPLIFPVLAMGLQELGTPRRVLGAGIGVGVFSILFIVFTNDYYDTVKKQQIREISGIVMSKQDSTDSLYSSLAAEYQFYFLQLGKKVTPLDSLVSAKRALPKNIWILQTELSEEEISGLKGYRVVEQHNLYNANAFRLEKVIPEQILTPQ
jgi:mannosyltransferase